jgi:sugar lactone lactonase YvrE
MRLHHAVFAVLALAAGTGLAGAQTAAPPDPNAFPNPYHEDAGWAQAGRTLGGTSAVDMDPDGKSVWIFERCGTPDDGCGKIKNLDPVMKFDAGGKLVKHWGAGQFLYPHGIFVGRDHHVWLVEGIAISGLVADMIHEYTEDGKLLRTMGASGTTGDSTDRFNGVSDVLVAPDGSIFVADGHSNKTNNRILKYDRDGKFLLSWGKLGDGPGAFNCPHGLAMDAKGRLYVADRSNNRIQIFDQQGKFLEEWKQFGRPSGVYIRGDMIYVADSLSNAQNNPGFRNGIRWGHISTAGKVEGYLPWGEYNAIEAVAVDKDGNIFAGFTNVPNFRKFVKN